MSDKKNSNWIANAKFFEYVKNNKGLQIAVVLLSVSIILVLFISSIDWGWTNNNTYKNDNTYNQTQTYVNNLEQKLASLISNISGAGRTSVMLTVQSGSEYRFASVDEKQFFTSLEEAKKALGNDTQVIVKEIYPTIKGAVIVCSGASDIKVKLDVLKAVQALLAIPSGNIEILEGN